MMYVAINLLLVFKKVAHLRRAFLLERASVTRLSKNSSVSAKLPRLWACRGHPSASVGPVAMSPLSSFVNIPSSPPVRLGGSPVFATVPCTPRASRRTPGPLLSPLCPPRALGAARAFAWPALSLRAGLSSSVPSSEKFPLSSRAAKPGSSFCGPRRSPLHPALSPTLSRAFTCLSPVSPVIRRTMRGWGPCASRPGVQGACPGLLYE